MKKIVLILLSLLVGFSAPLAFGEEKRELPVQPTYDTKTHSHGVSLSVGPDPWLIHYGRFTVDHPECSTISGSVLLTPDDIRFLAFYDDTHEDPMILAPVGDQPEPNIMISNAACQLRLSVSRSLGWNRDGGSAPGMTGRNKNGTSAQLPDMVTVIQYVDPNVSCIPLEIPFFLNLNHINIPQTQRLLQDYSISMRVQDSGQFDDLLIERPGCAVRIRLTLQILYNAAWRTSTFKQ